MVTCRDVLWYLVFCGFAINYMLRINLNLTIVAMVMPRAKGAAATAQCNPEIANTTLEGSGNLTVVSTAVPISENVTYEDRFAWTEFEQGLALGSYFWIHWLSQLPGGLLARRYGTKLVFGLGNLLTAVIGFLIPILTRQHLYALIALRVLQGLAAGVVWPSMHDMTAKWIPAVERSKFVSSYLGSSVGAAITYPLCAAVSSSYGWSAAFYVTSSLGVIWYCAWLFLAYDSPQEHPRISEEEKKYIIDNIRETVDEEKSEIPWKSILLSVPVWMTIAGQWGSGWGFLTLMTQTPSYFNFIHGWNINATGLVSGAPHLLRMIFSYYFSVFCDWLIRTKRMSLTNVRKLATFACTGVQGMFILFLAYSGCQPIFAVIFMIAGTTMNGAISASTLPNFVDLSPNYASVLLGFCGMIIIWSGFISPAIVGSLTNKNQTVEQWQKVFIIAAANSIASAVVYLLFGTSELQPWNSYGKPSPQKEQEMEKLTDLPVIKCEHVDEKTNGTEKDGILEKK
ncbi:sialin [Hylaeus anthracinus]|uniref:sialin n=1 Tax=Hylaeus anthracinus TaxID=313031 RepID=UPI0023BA33D8|nr:sialin [Hylaeus anthracinus]